MECHRAFAVYCDSRRIMFSSAREGYRKRYFYGDRRRPYKGAQSPKQKELMSDFWYLTSRLSVHLFSRKSFFLNKSGFQRENNGRPGKLDVSELRYLTSDLWLLISDLWPLTFYPPFVWRAGLRSPSSNPIPESSYGSPPTPSSCFWCRSWSD